MYMHAYIVRLLSYLKHPSYNVRHGEKQDSHSPLRMTGSPLYPEMDVMTVCRFLQLEHFRPPVTLNPRPRSDKVMNIDKTGLCTF